MTPQIRRRCLGALTIVAIAAIALLPIVVTDAYWRSVLTTCGVYAIFAVALDVIVGFVGIYSFGHAAFFGFGAYVSGLLISSANVSFPLALAAATFGSGALGAVLTFPVLRLKGPYFAIATLASAELLRLVAVNWTELTHGVVGLNVPSPAIPFVQPGHELLAFYYLAYGILIASCLVLARFFRSPSGRAVIGVRENEQLASAIGIPAVALKSAMLTVSAALAGAAGALYAPFVGIVSPDLVSVNYSALGLLMVIVGGQGTLVGPILGAFVFTVVTELFRVASDLRMICFSLGLIAAITLTPRGLIAPLLDLGRRSGAGRK